MYHICLINPKNELQICCARVVLLKSERGMPAAVSKQAKGDKVTCVQESALKQRLCVCTSSCCVNQWSNRWLLNLWVELAGLRIGDLRWGPLTCFPQESHDPSVGGVSSLSGNPVYDKSASKVTVCIYSSKLLRKTLLQLLPPLRHTLTCAAHLKSRTCTSWDVWMTCSECPV